MSLMAKEKKIQEMDKELFRNEIFLRKFLGEDGASERMTHWRSPFGLLLTNVILPGGG
ncbi:hypothetical protein ACLK1T_19830 [Escherichia coli]